jgi:hypothetical protein
LIYRIYRGEFQQAQEEAGQGQVFVRAAGVVEESVAVGLGVPQAYDSFEEEHDALLFVALGASLETVELFIRESPSSSIPDFRFTSSITRI